MAKVRRGAITGSVPLYFWVCWGYGERSTPEQDIDRRSNVSITAVITRIGDLAIIIPLQEITLGEVVRKHKSNNALARSERRLRLNARRADGLLKWFLFGGNQKLHCFTRSFFIIPPGFLLAMTMGA